MRADQALDVRRLPGSLRSREDFGDLHACELDAESVAIDAGHGPEQVARSRVHGTPDNDLRTVHSMVACSVTYEMYDAPALMGQNRKTTAA